MGLIKLEEIETQVTKKFLTFCGVTLPLDVWKMGLNLLAIVAMLLFVFNVGQYITNEQNKMSIYLSGGVWNLDSGQWEKCLLVKTNDSMIKWDCRGSSMNSSNNVFGSNG